MKRTVTIMPSGYGHWDVTSHLGGGKKTVGTTSNSVLIDRYNSLKNDRERGIIGVEERLHKIAGNK